MSDPVQRPASDDLREKRLFEIRRQAESKGRVEAVGIRPAGAPFPVASPETGYYGLPLLKQPAWTWQIPLYFFAGGAAGSAAVIGPVARWIGRDPGLARDCRYIAAVGTAASTRAAYIRSWTAIALPGDDARFQEAESYVGGGMDPGRIRHIRCRVGLRRNAGSTVLMVAAANSWQFVGGYLRGCRPPIFQLHGSADWRQRNPGVERECRNSAYPFRYVGIKFGGLNSRIDGT